MTPPTTSFRYRAATAQGELVEGVLQAPSQGNALEELRRQRLYPVELAELTITRAPARNTLGKRRALALFTRTLATLLGAGVTLERALAFAAKQAAHPDVAAA